MSKPCIAVLIVLALLTAANAGEMEDTPVANESAPAAARGQASSRSIVDTAFVIEAMKRGAIIWDVRPADDYKKGHISGAVNIGDPLKVLREDNSEDFISQDLIAQVLGSAGIDPAKEVVTYGAKANPAAYFALYTLEYFGANNAYVYHGGIEDWKAGGQRLSTQPAELQPLVLQLKPDPKIAVSTREVLGKLDDPGVQILDVRTIREFVGEDIRAIRGGHIPRAINIPYERNWTGAGIRRPGDPAPPNKDALALKSVDDLKALYANLDPDKETIVYCQSGSRASVTAAVLKDLGFTNVRLYDSSWLGYGNTLDAPAERVTFFNVGLMNGRIAAMQRRIEELEKELQALKANK